jgi:hypothetical protein
MSLAPGGLAHRATPVVNNNFVVVQLTGTGAHVALITAIYTQIGAITQDYPSTPLGILIGNVSGATMHIGTTNTGAPAPATDGIPIAADQSLYLPIESMGGNVTFKAAAAANNVCVAVFFS